VQAGDTVAVAAPRGTFYLTDGDAPVVLVSAGVGVTPVLSMLHQLATQQPEREVWWLHGARDGAEHAFAAESRDLLDGLTHAHRHIAYSRPGTADRLGTDYNAVGRLSPAMLRGLSLPAPAEAYVCGPASFMTDVSLALTECGLDAGRVHTETFGAGAALTPGVVTSGATAPHPPAGPPGTGPQVSFARSVVSAPWGTGYPALLEFAEACDVPTRWACRTGVCHTCETPLLSGAVRYGPGPLDAPAVGNVLICCAQPTEDVVLGLLDPGVLHCGCIAAKMHAWLL
jgi:ferredoxin-NADP reductase